MSLRLLIADDHPLVRAGIRMVLSATMEPLDVFEAIDGHDALAVAGRTHPHVTLMDISMPGLNGLEATRRLVHQQPECKVVILSMHKDEQRVVEAMRAGAAGYLVKDSAVEEVPLAIRTVLNGGIFTSRGVPRIASTVLSHAKPKNGPLELLTGRQREILQLIAEGQSTKEISYRLNLSGKTVETHRRQLMLRLEIFDVASLARFAVRSGLVTADVSGPQILVR